MTSRGYDPRQSPGLGYKRVVSCKDSFHGTDVLAVSEHGAPGRRPNIHAHFVGRQRDGLDTTAGPRRRIVERLPRLGCDGGSDTLRILVIYCVHGITMFRSG